MPELGEVPGTVAMGDANQGTGIFVQKLGENCFD